MVAEKKEDGLWSQRQWPERPLSPSPLPSASLPNASTTHLSPLQPEAPSPGRQPSLGPLLTFWGPTGRYLTLSRLATVTQPTQNTPKLQLRSELPLTPVPSSSNVPTAKLKNPSSSTKCGDPFLMPSPKFGKTKAMLSQACALASSCNFNSAVGPPVP